MFRALLDFLWNAHVRVTRGYGAEFETPARPLRSLALTPYLVEVELPPLRSFVLTPYLVEVELPPHLPHREFDLVPVGLFGFRRRPAGRAFRIAAPGGCLPAIELRW